MSGMTLGFDFGSSYGRYARSFVNGDKFFVHKFSDSTTIASKVYFPNADSKDMTIVGTPAIQQGTIRPNLYFKAFKRGMDDNAVIEREGGFRITPVELSAIVLKKLLATAEAEENQGSWVPDGVVISVPATFNDKQIFHVKRALELALEQQFKCRKGNDVALPYCVVLEPIAVGLYCLSKYNDIFDYDMKILVFDLGASRLDISVLDLNKRNKELSLKILATDGGWHIAGEIFDKLLYSYVLKSSGYEETDMSQNAKTLLYQRCEELKCELTEAEEAEIFVPYIVDQQHLERVVARKEFERCLNGEVDGLNYISLIEDMLCDVMCRAGISHQDINGVLLCGGSSCIPCVRNVLHKYFSAEIALAQDAIAKGAALYGAYELEKECFAIKDVKGLKINML